MANAIILHGLPDKHEYYSEAYPSASNSHWLPWLQKHLMINDIKADTPEVPNIYDPKYEIIVREVERFDINSETILVGHSMGAGFWIRYLTEHPEITVNKMILVAPWLNPDHEYDIDLFDFDIDQDLMKRVHELTVFISDDDGQAMHDSVAILHNKLPAITIKTFREHGHFTLKSMGTDAFPELLEVALAS